MSEPEKPDTSSPAAATGAKPQVYKCLLNQHAQKIWKQFPMYQTLNEGSLNSPKFRCTVWVDGVGYTSTDTFQQRKMAEMDASRIALFGVLLKLKNEASRLVHEDKSFCKSILVEYAARMNIQKPIYQTVQLDTPAPVFRSSLVFNDVSCTGENSKSKKEAEQSAARAVILKCLDCESGSILSEMIRCKFKRFAEMKNIQSAHDGTNELVPARSENGTIEVVTTGSENGTTEVVPTVSENGTNDAVPAGSENGLTSVQDPIIPATHLSLDLNQKHTEEVSPQAVIPVIQVPAVLAQTPSGTHNAPTSVISAPSLGHIDSIPVTHPSSNAVQLANSEASSVTVASLLPLSSPALVQAPCVGPVSGKRQNHKNKKQARKKARFENQSPIPAIPLSQVPTFSAQ